MKLTNGIALTGLISMTAGASLSYADNSDLNQQQREAPLEAHRLINPGDHIWPQPPQPTSQDLPESVIADAKVAAAKYVFVSRNNQTSASLQACCAGKTIVGGGVATYTSNISTAGQIWQRLDLLFALREPTGIPGLEGRDEFAKARVVATFLRGDQAYARCDLELYLTSRAMHFDLVVESIDEHVSPTVGRCDTGLQTLGIQKSEGVPQMYEQDRIEIFVFKGLSEVVKIGEGTVSDF